MLRPAVIAASLAVTLLAGCDMLGIESPEKIAAAREADGRAVGAACRHAGRAIEDCYTLNRRVDKAAIFAGWRDMNDYMRENKIDTVTPVLMAQAPAKPADAKADAPKADGKGAAAVDGEARSKGKDAKDPKDSKG
ncbi:MAG TPA: hypothetical protein VJ743_23435 [Albitalea sp.]|nr:hypothetical protein [Albitalea sp.]